jgi:hypothetical protein
MKRQDPLHRHPAIDAVAVTLCEKHLCHPATRDPALQDVLSEPYAAVGRHRDILLRHPAQAAVRTGFSSQACNCRHLLTERPDDVSRCQALVTPSESQFA